jgi:predicted nucleotidyltransferase
MAAKGAAHPVLLIIVKPLIPKDLLDLVKTPRKNELMNCEQVLATLRAHEPTLKAVGVAHLSLFGSTARGDRRPDSDVDLLAAFDRTRRISLLDVVGIEIQLSELLGQPVDLIEEGTLKPRVQRTVEAEAVRAF